MSFDEALAEVLRQGKYNRLAGRWFDWRAWIFQRVMDIINWILKRLRLPEISVSGGGGTGQIFIIILFLLLAAAVALSAVFILTRIRKKRELGAVFDGIDQNADPMALVEAANAMFHAGRARAAARYCFAASLLALDAQRIIRVTKSKTNNQLRRELRKAAPALAEVFNVVTGGFNDLWFGHKTASAEDYEKISGAAAALITEADEHKKI